jgi:hypothetical protein
MRWKSRVAVLAAIAVVKPPDVQIIPTLAGAGAGRVTKPLDDCGANRDRISFRDHTH